MRTPAKIWTGLIAAAVICALLWFKFGYPLFSHIDLSVDRNRALTIAQQYLTKQQSVDPSAYNHAVVFAIDQHTDTYLQHRLGFTGEKEFFEKHNFEIFFWLVRFFKDKEKEEYLLTISCKTGEVTAFRHTIEDSAPKPKLEKEEAQSTVENFLKGTFSFNLDDYTLKSDFSHELDNRTDHSFSWQKKVVFIPWKMDEPDKGGAHLVMGATISGNEILSFSKYNLELPEDYYRDRAAQESVGLNLLTVTKILYLALFVAAVFYLILRRNHLAMTTTQRFYFNFAGLLFICSILSQFNELEDLVMKYDTTQSMTAFYTRYAIDTVIGIFFATIRILIPSLSGEALHAEVFPKKKEGSFLHNIRTSFLTRQFASLIFAGYLCAIIMLGLQAALFKFGAKYCDLWFEQTWATQLSTAYVPFFAAFYLGIRASFWEEIMFRMFSVSWLTRVFKRTFPAIIVSSLIWGLGHSGYPIFPMWFRAVEVTALGMLLSWVYLRFGLISAIVAHYLFDVFWYSSGYLLGKTQPEYFYSLLLVLFLPLILGLIAFLVNKNDPEKGLNWKLNQHQAYNLEVLKHYLKTMEHIKDRSAAELKKEIVKHGWDVAVVDLAIHDLKAQGKVK